MARAVLLTGSLPEGSGREERDMESKTKYRLLAGVFALGIAAVAGVVKPGRLSGKAVGGDPGEGCGAGEDELTEETIQSATQAVSIYESMSDTEIAQRFRPYFRLRSDHQNWPLTFKEGTDLKDHRNTAYNENFAVF